ncbi:metal ABC transporter substrate-binding protein [Trichocoleus sp. FACHB-591]|uniref:metal ABC transporter substrate-binding protein n=1 Tax=Trichocoleus sp. FACHB-591 TaxID=2692872 RepID=UPI001688B44C|nr:metal ABC transporter substrate-binding protein [Trichocoleus sp. FACHB-591]MBD2097606.1 metal ABC transporter substrate-binding protein [Trichocoleus sp. FACHB-591]
MITAPHRPQSGHPQSGYKIHSYGQAIAGLLLSVWLSGCNIGSQPAPNQSAANGAVKPSVVSTSTILTDLTAQIAADEVQLIGILEPGTDPHVYEPVPADSRDLEKADLIFYNGYNLEPGLIKLMNAAGGRAQKVAVGEVVPPLQLQKGQRETVPDPHVWGNVKNVMQMVTAIRDALIELSPDDRDRFTQNAAQLTAQLEELDQWITQQIQTIPPEKRRLVTTHDAFQYYARAYNLDIIGTLIGISTEEQPSAQTVQRLVESVKSAQVPAIFAETTINPALIKTVAQEAGVQLAPRSLYSDSIGAAGSDGDSYIKMMVVNTQTIVEALGGKVTPFQPSHRPQSTNQKP